MTREITKMEGSNGCRKEEKSKIGHSHVDDGRGRRLINWGYITTLRQLDKLYMSNETGRP
jgi:hypothetical protein